jgi:3-deoxy-D-manno-octulosonate 8-phosphate phosphatase (KDO 8-P phosphatase)
LGYPNKIPVYEELLNSLHLENKNIAYVGDDLPDLPLILRAGLGITVPNAVPEVLAKTLWVTHAKGGEGAVREVCESVMRATGKWENMIKRFMTTAIH